MAKHRRRKRRTKEELEKTKSYWKKECFNLVSEIVILRDGKCIETNATKKLQAAHIISRGYKNTAWDLENVVTLKVGRHKWYTHRPLEWEIFIDSKFGAGYYERLKKRALNYRKWTLEELKELYVSLEKIRNSFDRRTGKFKDQANPGGSNG